MAKYFLLVYLSAAAIQFASGAVVSLENAVAEPAAPLPIVMWHGMGKYYLHVVRG